MTADIDVELAVAAYGRGFCHGADPSRKPSKRTVVEPLTHEHFMRGYRDGRAAIDAHEQLYRAEMKR